MTLIAAGAALVGWTATILVLGHASAALAVPALAGWSVSAVIGIDATRRRERVPALVTLALVSAAAIFVAVAAIAR